MPSRAPSARAFGLSFTQRNLGEETVSVLRVQFEQWAYGTRKIDLIQSIRAHTDLGLKDAKDVVDALLSYEFPIVEVESGSLARSLIAHAHTCGATATVVDDPALYAEIAQWVATQAEPFDPCRSLDGLFEELKRLAEAPGSGVTLEPRVDASGSTIRSYVIRTCMKHR